MNGGCPDMPRLWFRMYARFITDPVVEELSFEDQRHFVFLLCLKCDGLLDKEFDDNDKRDRAIARRLGLQGDAFTFAKDRLVASGLIDRRWQPKSWDELQFESDGSAERQKRYRDRKKGALRNGDVTVTAQEQSRADTEQNRTEGADAPSGLDLTAWKRWLDYRKQIGKPLKPASIPAAQRKLAAFGTSQSDVVEQSVAQGWTGIFPLKQDARNPVNSVEQHEREALRKLMERRVAIGIGDFREPLPGESSKAYAAAQHEAWQALKRKPVDMSKLGGAALKVLQ